MKRIAIIGDGGWGTALGIVLHRNGHAVRMWGPFADYIAEIQATGENRKFLPGIPCPTDIEWTSDRAAALEGADAAVLAIPSKFYRDVVSGFLEECRSLAETIRHSAPQTDRDRAKAILAGNPKAPANTLRKLMQEASIPQPLIDELAPAKKEGLLGGLFR